MVRAGLPACFWTFACWHSCLAENIVRDDTGESPWSKTHGEQWNGPEIPFGAAVIYRPSDTVAVVPGKIEPTGRMGIFAGYQIEYGYKMAWQVSYEYGILTSLRKFVWQVIR